MAQRTEPLDALDPEDGATYGDWIVWIIEYGHDRAMVWAHKKSKQIVRVHHDSNGWIDHYHAGTPYTSYSGDSTQQLPVAERSESYLDHGAPAVGLATGRCYLGNWTADVGDDQVVLTQPEGGSKIVIRKHSSSWDYDGTTFPKGGKGCFAVVPLLLGAASLLAHLLGG